jgi:hypothetical protein
MGRIDLAANEQREAARAISSANLVFVFPAMVSPMALLDVCSWI